MQPSPSPSVSVCRRLPSPEAAVLYPRGTALTDLRIRPAKGGRRLLTLIQSTDRHSYLSSLTQPSPPLESDAAISVSVDVCLSLPPTAVTTTLLASRVDPIHRPPPLPLQSDAAVAASQV